VENDEKRGIVTEPGSDHVQKTCNTSDETSENTIKKTTQRQKQAKHIFFNKKRRAIKELPFYQNIMTKTTTSHLNHLLQIF
jgi:hypothetical protein